MNAKVRNAGELDERGGNLVLKEKPSSSTTLGAARSSTEWCGARCLGVLSMWSPVDECMRNCVSAICHATAMKSCEISVRQRFAIEGKSWANSLVVWGLSMTGWFGWSSVLHERCGDRLMN